MLILGISELDNDSGAVLLRDGQLVGAANEERFSRVKQQDGVPYRTIEWLLKAGGVGIGDVDKVLVVRQDVHAEYPHSLRELDQVNWFSYDAPLTWKFLNWGAWKFRNYRRIRDLSRLQNQRFLDWIRDNKVDPAKVERPNHHFMHATCTYYGSGFDKAMAFTVDGQGDGETATVWWCDNGRFDKKHAIKLPHSAGAFYAAITKAAGFRPARHEGKITGLAARGQHDEECMAFARKQLYYTDGTWEAPYNYGSYPYLQRLLKKKGSANLAYAYQNVLEDVMVKYVSHWTKKLGARNLCIAGGVVANVRVNQRLHEIPEVENIFIFPHMSDGGLGWGAAWHAHHEQRRKQLGDKWRYEPQRVHDVYWGPNYTDEYVEGVLKREGVRYTRPADLERMMADMLVDGELIARFHGAMEFGPRALCHRSILYQPTDPHVNDWLNERLHRTEFMPFAPVTREEDAAATYENLKGAEHAANFMTITFFCKPHMMQQCPAVVHVDNTARPQTVRPDLDASTHKLLGLYKEKTGLTALINTSFNMHEEPIVCSPEDAVRACRDARFRYLAIGRFLAEFDNPPPPQAKPTRRVN